jgi:hypothetical protein
MNEEGTKPNEEVNAIEETKPQAGEIGAPEGAEARADTKDVQAMYDDLGIKAKAPSDKPKGRPKADASGDKKTAEQNDASGKSEQKQKDDDSKDDSKATPTSSKDGLDGDETDEKSKKSSKSDGKDGKEDGEVQESSESDEKRVQKAESKDNDETGKTSKGDAEEGNEGTGEDSEVKRPGKSNPEVEKRFQKLTGDVKERDGLIADLQQKLQESSKQQAQSKVAQEDPEYKIEDFRKVRDDEGNVMDLDEERAELAWRRWKDGYDQRSEEREARTNFEASQAEKSEAKTRQMMQDSSDAYDTLAGLMDEYPELVKSSNKFDSEFAADAMPIIEEAVQYQEGTEPGNAEGKPAVIVGLRINPKKILAALKNAANKKRSMPLNGLNDSVEKGSNLNVSHSRSSDSNVNAANQLYKELGIKKRI